MGSKKIRFLAITLLILTSACNNDLSRNKAEELFSDEDSLDFVVGHFKDISSQYSGAERSGAKRWKDRGYLVTNEYFEYKGNRRTNRKVSLVQPTENLIHYINWVYSVTLDQGRFKPHKGLAEMKPILGEVTSKKVTGIQIDSQNQNARIAEFEMDIELNEIGKIELGDESIKLPLFVKYALYDDGWRYEDYLWDKMLSDPRWPNILTNMASKEGYAKKAIEYMYKYGVYSINYSELSEVLLNTDDYNNKLWGAWAYHNNGDVAKAKKVFVENVIPWVNKNGTDEQKESVQEGYKKLDEDKPYLEELAQERAEQSAETLSALTAQHAAINAKKEKEAERKAEREKQRKLAEEKREAERKEAERIANLKRLSKISGKTLGQFSCRGKSPGEFSSKPKNFTVTDVAIRQTAEDKRLCFGYGTESTLYFVDMKGSPVVETCYKRETDSSCLKFFNQNGKRVYGNDIEFTSVSEGKRFFSTFKPALDAWREKYSELVK